MGRSPECHITIEDPLISRQHAKIIVTGLTATFVDLGSRNGSRLNGRLVTDATVLTDSDRVRLGAQELVFLVVGADRRMARSTGAMRLCARCKTPFPEGPEQCPHCGHPTKAPSDEDTMAGIGVPARRGWILQLLGEVLERALATGKLAEAERLLRRAAEETEDRIAAGEVAGAQLAQMSEYALHLAMLQNDARWVAWVMTMYGQARLIPTATVVDAISGAMKIPGVVAALRDYVRGWDQASEVPMEADATQLARIEQMIEPGTDASAG